MKKLLSCLLLFSLFLTIAPSALAENLFADKLTEIINIDVTFNGGIVFGDSESDVKSKEKIKLTKESVDGIAVLGADKIKLRGVRNSSLNYCFKGGKLVQVYEYFNDKCSSAQGKKDYAAVEKELVAMLREPLPASQHFDVTTLGFDVDEYFATLRRYGSSVKIHQRSMWAIPDGDQVILVDHVGLDFGDMYKHYLFFLIVDKDAVPLN